MRWIFLAFCASIFLCCSDSGTSSPSVPHSFIQEDAKHVGMMLVNSKDSSVKLSSKLTVEFTYNFSIDKHEVTREEYAKYIKTAHFDYPPFPVSDITFFDAILFANEKSKSENLDTAYSYISASFDSDGHCTGMVGYEFHADRNAYRLPTEAEWTLVASHSWNPSNAWTAENSNYTLQLPCTADTLNGFCDFTGNAMEWVNDWMGDLRDTTVTNYAGASDGGNIGERIIKGGCYRNEASRITLDTRSDVYTVTSSTKAFYIGFRLAFGKIPNAVWMSKKGNVTSSPINVLSTSAQLKSLTNTHLNKLVFRNDETGNIAIVNFSSGKANVREIEDSVDAYHPTLSPDGKYVAFSTKYEGISGESELFVRRIDSLEADKIKLEVQSAAIPRWRVTNADTEIVYITTAENNSDQAIWEKKSTWSVPFANGKFGTPKKLYDGSFNGGVSTDGKFAVSGASLLRTNVNGKNSIWYNNEQACNVSLSDLTKQTLFLDFAGNTGKNFAGHQYTTHEQLLIADSTGELIKMIPAPKGYTFDHTEWVHNSGNLAVATLTSIDGTHPKIVLVNTNDSSITEIASGAELWHPDLWTGVLQNFETALDVDSAGMYELDSPFTGDMSPMNTRYDLEMLYKYRDSINVLVSGSSRPWAGIDPLVLNKNPDIFSINAANPAVDLSVAKRILFHYGFNFLPKLKVVTVSLDLDILFQRHYELPSFWDVIYLKSPGFIYDEAHEFWPNGYPQGLYELTRDSYGSDEQSRSNEQDRLGHKFTPDDGWQGNPIYVDSTYMDAEVPNPENMLIAEIEDFIKEAESKNLYLIGIIFPQSPDYKETGSFGRYGLRRSVAEKMIAMLKGYEEKYPHFILMDENQMGMHDYGDEMAFNCDHLSYKGAEKLTKRLDSLIQTLNIEWNK